MYNSNNSMKTWINGLVCIHFTFEWSMMSQRHGGSIHNSRVINLYHWQYKKTKNNRKWKPFRKSFLEKCTNVGKVIVLKRRFYNRHLRLLHEMHCVVNLITRTVQYSNAMGRNYPFMTSKNRLHKIQMFKNSYANMYNKIYHCINTNKQ